MGTFKEIMEIVIITNNKLNNSFQNIYCFQAVVWIQRKIISNQLIMFSRYERAKLGMFLGYLSPLLRNICPNFVLLHKNIQN